VRERLRRVRGEPSGQDLSRRVFVGGMPFTYEVRRERPVSPCPAFLRAGMLCVH